MCKDTCVQCHRHANAELELGRPTLVHACCLSIEFLVVLFVGASAQVWMQAGLPKLAATVDKTNVRWHGSGRRWWCKKDGSLHAKTHAQATLYWNNQTISPLLPRCTWRKVWAQERGREYVGCNILGLYQHKVSMSRQHMEQIRACEPMLTPMTSLGT